MYFYLSKILAPFLNLTNFLFFLLIILIFFNLKKQIRFKKLIIICLFVLTTISLFPLGKLGLKYLEKDYLIQMNYYNIDNIIVLSGSEDLETTKITNKLNLNEGSERLIASVKIADTFYHRRTDTAKQCTSIVVDRCVICTRIRWLIRWVSVCIDFYAFHFSCKRQVSTLPSAIGGFPRR